MRLVVSGTRRGRPDVAHWLDRFVAKYGRPELVILGDARGVDQQARDWARGLALPCEVYRAQWHALGKRAGMVRNQAMVEQAGPGDYCLAFPSEDSRGTWDCIARAKARGLETFVLRPARIP